MEKRVLFIGEANSFIVNALKDGLKEPGFECLFCKLDVTDISRLTDKPEFFFI